MKNKDTLHGTEFNSHGWTEGARMHKNAKRMLSTFEDKPVSNTKKEKVKVVCSDCRKTFNLSKSATKLPSHNKKTAQNVFNENTKRYDIINIMVSCNGTLIKESNNNKLAEYVIKDVVIKPGNTIVYESSERFTITKSERQIYEKTVKTILESVKVDWNQVVKRDVVVVFTDGSKMDSYIYEIVVL